MVSWLRSRRLTSAVIAAWFTMDDFDAQRSGAAVPGVPLQRPGSAQPADTNDFSDFDEFYRRSVPSLVAFLVWQGTQLVEAANIVQDTMSKACQEWPRIDQPMAWARTAASRKLARCIASIDNDTDGQLLAYNSLVPGSFDREIWERPHEVLRMLDRLSSRQRQMIAWTLEGYSPTEIASELHLGLDAVRVNLAQARRILGNYLGTTRDER
jgi:DNA-directed RNA polymerase specialized sigma24 family protein